MKFTVLEPEGFAQDELKVVKLLEVDPFFEKVVRDIRRKTNWPEEGLRVEIDSHGKTKIIGLDDEKDKRLDNMKFDTDAPISLLLSTYRLPYSWWVVFNSIILLNTVIPPNKDDEWYQPVEVRYVGALTGVKNKLSGTLEHPNQGKPHIESI